MAFGETNLTTFPPSGGMKQGMHIKDSQPYTDDTNLSHSSRDPFISLRRNSVAGDLQGETAIPVAWISPCDRYRWRDGSADRRSLEDQRPPPRWFGKKLLRIFESFFSNHKEEYELFYSVPRGCMHSLGDHAARVPLMGDPERLTAVMVSLSPEIEVTYLPSPALPPPLSASLDLKSGYAVVLEERLIMCHAEELPTVPIKDIDPVVNYAATFYFQRH
ncbi:uncharacterized protein LOC113147446 [Cyclospora cayetanensis]|uniref:Uncharacterized protein LOC113147446 n=1 Tax=Cyclospora cayetanensis TaxID=88456 RepID=A0A6P6S2G2_9EIME|nr:uncharacterized protein LOC113147446 [Cyclospora cayetanensis]